MRYLLAAVAIFISSPGLSQPSLMDLMPSLAGYDPIAIALKQHPKRDEQAATRQVRLSNPAVLAFESSATRRRANYAQFVERSRRTDPAGAADLAATLRTDPIASMGPQLATFGLKTNNLADAYVVYLVEAWQAVHGRSDEGSREQAQAIKQQVTTAFLSSPGVVNASVVAKQEYADSLLVQALLIGAARHQAQGDTAKLRAISEAVLKGARAQGLDLRSISLTPQGIVLGKKTGALNLPSAAEEPKQAGSGDGTMLAAALLGLSAGGLWMVRGKRTSG